MNGQAAMEGGEARWRAEPASMLIVRPVEELQLIFHRPSGLTHIVTEPAPQILAALADQQLTMDELLQRLSMQYELSDDPEEAGGMAHALMARVEELRQLGLVRRA